MSNAWCPCRPVEDEQAQREEAVAAQSGPWRALLPKLRRDLAKLPDPRNPTKSKHKLTVVLLSGWLAFVFPIASRREANRVLSRPVLFQTLPGLFAERETLPLADTLHRVVERREVAELEAAQVGVVRRLIRNKQFQRFLIERCYPVAIDGTQKLVREGRWDGEGEWLERVFDTAEGERVQQDGYVLEANLVFHHGVTLPLLSAFLSYAPGDRGEQPDAARRACKRVAQRLQGYVPRVPVRVLRDGR